jgi:heme exporter protein A
VRRDLERVRRSVALLGHQSYLYEALSARENLEITASFLGRTPAPGLLARVGLEARADDPVVSYSAGMRKRLALARVLLQEKPIVLLDEPYGELDPPGFALLDGVIRELRARGATVIMATHLVDHGRTLSDHALLLEAGRLAWSGPAAAMPAEAPGSAPR